MPNIYLSTGASYAAKGTNRWKRPKDLYLDRWEEEQNRRRHPDS